MKKFIFILFVINFSSLIGFAQSGWFWQNPLPTGNYSNDMIFFNENTGICKNPDNLLKTTDGGLSWLKVSASQTAFNDCMLFTDASRGFLLLSDKKFLRTENGGLNWNYVSDLPADFDNAYPITYFIDNYTGFILGRYFEFDGTSILRTTNGGNIWSVIYADSVNMVYSMNFLNNSTGYMDGGTKLFKTTNGGIRWDSISGNQSLPMGPMKFFDENTGIMCSSYYSQNQYYGLILKTTNGGVNWNTKQNVSGAHETLCFINISTGFAMFDNNKLFKTTDMGETWEFYDLNLFSSNNYIYDIFFCNGNTGYGTGAAGLIGKTTDGGATWAKLSKGHANDLYNISFLNNNNGIATGALGLIFTTSDAGLNWVQSNLVRQDLYSLSSDGGSSFYAAAWNDGKIFHTKNNGISWDTLYANIYGITKLKFINQMTGFGVCKYSYFIKTTNAGHTWSSNSSLNQGENWSMDFLDENTGYAGGSVLYKTTNGGDNWTNLNQSNMYSADIQFIDNNTGYIGGSFGNTPALFKTTDGGNTWITRLLSFHSNYVVDINFVNANTGYIISTQEMQKTTDGGNTFINIHLCSKYNSLYALTFTDSITGYCVGSDGAIIKTITGGISPTINIPGSIPVSYSLSQNYPNPFNPITKIKFSVPSAGNGRDHSLQLKIYDILGREVATLVNEQLQPGTYSVEWNAEGFASGIYFYSLTTDEFSQTKKMVLLK